MEQTINIYRNNGEWCYAAFIGGEFDSSDTLDAENETEARAEVSAMFPGSAIKRVEDTHIGPKA